MNVVQPAEISEDELKRLDAQYEPFPAFTDWTAEIVRTDLWEQTHGEIAELQSNVQPQDLQSALDFVMRAAALDTGAIEGLYKVDRGFTITVAAQAAAWQAEMESRGENIRPLFEAQLKTFDLVLDVATNKLPVTEAWLRRVHEELTAPQETYTVHTAVGSQEHPLPRGAYKSYPNHVRVQDGTLHSYAPVDLTRSEMHRLVGELERPEFASAHPAQQAAYAHYALVAVHPFADGNGRVARAVASVYLYRAATVPLLIFADRKFDYFDVLHAADLGDHAPFTRFIFDAGISAMNLVVENVRTAQTPDAGEALRNLHRLLTAQGGLTHQELDSAAHGFLNQINSAMNEAIQGLTLPPGVTATVGGSAKQPGERSGFREILAGGHPRTGVHLSSPPPATATVEAAYHVLVSRERDESETFILDRLDTGEVLRFALRDVHPELTAAAKRRIDAFAHRILGELTSQLTAAAEQALHQAGYF